LTYSVNFGESGKNFSEIGKWPEGWDTMLRPACVIEAEGARYPEAIELVTGL